MPLDLTDDKATLVRQPAITWANVDPDLCRQMASLGLNELKHFLWNCPQVNATEPHWLYINIVSGDGLVPSGNKPLPVPVLTYLISIAIWCRYRPQWLKFHLATVVSVKNRQFPCLR